MGLCRDNGKENGSYYLGSRVYNLGIMQGYRFLKALGW